MWVAKRSRIPFGLALASLLLSRGAFAEPVADGAPTTTASVAATEAPAPSEAKTSWYGWQILAADSGSVLTGYGVGAGLKSTEALVVGGVGYLAVAPIIHAIHGRGGAAAGSLGMRALVPLGGTFLGMLMAEGSGESALYRAVKGGVTGFTVGIGLTTILDVALLSFETTSSRPTTSSPRLLPNLVVREGGTEVTLSGMF